MFHAAVSKMFCTQSEAQIVYCTMLSSIQSTKKHDMKASIDLIDYKRYNIVLHAPLNASVNCIKSEKLFKLSENGFI